MMTETKLPPNPEDWTDTDGAARMLGRSRPTVYDMVERGVLVRYHAGSHAIFWVPEVREVAAALARTTSIRRPRAVRRG